MKYKIKNQTFSYFALEYQINFCSLPLWKRAVIFLNISKRLQSLGIYLLGRWDNENRITRI